MPNEKIQLCSLMFLGRHPINIATLNIMSTFYFQLYS